MRGPQRSAGPTLRCRGTSRYRRPMRPLPKRKGLPHEVPPWVADAAIYFVTINSQPRGQDQLCACGAALWESIQFNAQRGLWWPKLVLVMPDHLHALLVFGRGVSIQGTVTAWKHYTAHALGIHWQRDFFEHRVRADESLMEKAHYIRMNPVRKGLCQLPAEWPHVWSCT